VKKSALDGIVLLNRFSLQPDCMKKRYFLEIVILNSLKKNLNHGLLEKMRSSEMWQKYLKVRAKNQVISLINYPKLKIAGEVMV
jgi:hypothetical protein